MVEQVAPRSAGRPEIVRVPAPPGEMPDTLADIRLAGRELGYAPRVPLPEGLARFVAWWQRQSEP